MRQPFRPRAALNVPRDETYLWGMPPPASAPVVLDAFPGIPELAGVHAFFTTRAGGVSRGAWESLNLGPRCGDDPDAVRRNWDLLLESRGLAGRAPVLPRLCHGAALAEAADAADTDVDAVYTHRRGTLLAVTMADCLPALVADPETGCVAAVHAGWRGTRDNILGAALARLLAEGRIRADSVRVALGPCLSADALELGEDVAATLPQAHVVRGGDGAARPRFDLRGCNRAQAVAAGVPPERIADLGGCTHARPDLFFSHRRDGGNTGRMAACILLT